MYKEIKFKILPDINLIIESYFGEINIDDVIELKKQEIQLKDYNPTINYIADYRDANLNLNKKEFLRFINYANHNNKIAANRRVAFLTSTPKQVVYTSMYELLSKNLPIKIGVFSTLESAIAWLDIPMHNLTMLEELFLEME